MNKYIYINIGINRLVSVLIVFFSLILEFNASAQYITLNAYSGQTEIKASGSVTLTDGFYIPIGNTVRIFTGGSFQDCIPLTWTSSTNQNYVRSRVFKVAGVNNINVDSPRSICEVNQTVHYLDGLGRPLQTVTVQGSPTFRDVVQPVEYDAFGREVKKHLPYATALVSSNGSYKSTALADQAAFYNNPVAHSAPGVSTVTNSAFTETRFEATPLNRVLEQGAPGASWQISAGHTQKMEYGTNNLLTGYATTGFAVRLYKADEVTASGQEYKRILSGTGYYAVNELYLTITKDENWVSGDGKAGTIEEYKDKEGHVVLKRTFNRTPAPLNAIEVLSTYYVYDDLGNLSFVLPPGTNPDSVSLPSQTVLDNFSYQYRYDVRKRLIEKKLPGKGWEYMVYNELDQIVFSQDTKQMNVGKWIFTKYDALGRVVITGLYGDASGRSALQAAVNTHGDNGLPLWETRTNNGVTDYTNSAMPNSNIELYYTMNYYDDYNFMGMQSVLPAQNTASSKTKGLLTGTKVYQTDGILSNWTLNYYDDEGRLQESLAQNHLGGTDRVVNTYNFSDELISRIRTHVVSDATTTIANRYEYDHMRRKKAVFQSINGQSEVVLSKMDYNEIGQLLKKSLHSSDGATFLQHTDYTYNERGWMKTGTSDQFSVKLKYDDGTSAQYNGNIANQEWGAGSNFPNVYTYSYDKLNRLGNGTSTGITMSEVLTYDVMGNIRTLSRDGGAVGTYNYTGNQLQKITGGALATGTYLYDENGSVTFDGRNGVTLTYNHLSLPITVVKSGLNMAYTYDATGQKLRKVSTSEATSDYVDGIQYTGGEIEFVITEEGKARNNSGVYSYEYNLTDHLGNIRYTFYKNPISGLLERLQADDYYPFGRRRIVSAGMNKYLYNGKELQEELGQLDYGARFYDPVIGRFNVIDRFAEKYAGLTQYQYGANNPISNIDINGDSTWTTTKQIKNGNNITIYNTTHITGRVLKPSMTYGGSAGEIASNLNRRLNAQSGTETNQNELGGTTTTIYNIDAKYKGADSMDDVKSSDHLVVIVDDVGGTADPNLGGGAAGGVAKLFGKVAYAEGGVGVVETAFHEVGHNLGLIHPKVNSRSDPMSYSGDGSNFSVKQMNAIFKGARYGFPNDGYNSARITNVTERYNSRSSNTRPYLGTRKQGMRIPLPIKD